MRNLILICSMVGLLVAGAFSYGFAVGKYEIFPYQILKTLRHGIDQSGAANDTIRTNFVKLRTAHHNIDNPHGLKGSGGGITTLQDKILGVDRTGQFYVFDGSGLLQPLELKLDTGITEYLAYVDKFTEDNDDKEWKQFLVETFRVYDVLADVDGNQASLYVSYDHWNDEDLCVTLNVSRWVVDLPADIFADGLTVAADNSNTIFQSSPCMTELDKIHGARSGGRIALDKHNNLIVSIGDFGHDGTILPNYPQNDDVSYGKIMSIDLETLDASVISKGVRNPQGLHIDSDGNIWETEHGPTGGDELNEIKPGRNYGWPNVTYGDTHENRKFGAERRRHLGYERPMHTWNPSLGISNLIQVNQYPQEWDKDLLVATLKTGKLVRLKIQDNRVIFQESVVIGERLRDIEQMPDGTIILWTDSAKLIEVSVDTTAADNVDDEAAFIALARDAQMAIRECQSCHDLSADSSTLHGPPLWNVFEREIARTDYSDYSDALRDKNGNWDEESLRAFLMDPHEFARGTTMPNPYIRTMATLNEVVTYLKQLGQ